MAKLGRIRTRIRGNDGAREFYLDFRPIGRVWSNRGIRISDEGTARRLLEKIREHVAEGVSVEEVLARYQPIGATANLVPTWLARWIELRRREMSAGSLSPNFVRELERLAAPGGHFSFFDRTSIHEVTYGLLEDWSLWLAERQQSPKSRRNFRLHALLPALAREAWRDPEGIARAARARGGVRAAHPRDHRPGHRARAHSRRRSRDLPGARAPRATAGRGER